jgi:hypothetical protein
MDNFTFYDKEITAELYVQSLGYSAVVTLHGKDLHSSHSPPIISRAIKSGEGDGQDMWHVWHKYKMSLLCGFRCVAESISNDASLTSILLSFVLLIRGYNLFDSYRFQFNLWLIFYFSIISCVIYFLFG